MGLQDNARFLKYIQFPLLFSITLVSRFVALGSGFNCIGNDDQVTL